MKQVVRFSTAQGMFFKTVKTLCYKDRRTRQNQISRSEEIHFSDSLSYITSMPLNVNCCLLTHILGFQPTSRSI